MSTIEFDCFSYKDTRTCRSLISQGVTRQSLVWLTNQFKKSWKGFSIILHFDNNEIYILNLTQHNSKCNLYSSIYHHFSGLYSSPNNHVLSIVQLSKHSFIAWIFVFSKQNQNPCLPLHYIYMIVDTPPSKTKTLTRKHILFLLWFD